MGELVNRRADIGIGGIGVMAERENVIDFTVPFYDVVGITILMKKSKVSGSLVYKYIIILVVLCYSIILFILMYKHSS